MWHQCKVVSLEHSKWQHPQTFSLRFDTSTTQPGIPTPPPAARAPELDEDIATRAARRLAIAKGRTHNESKNSLHTSALWLMTVYLEYSLTTQVLIQRIACTTKIRWIGKLDQFVNSPLVYKASHPVFKLVGLLLIMQSKVVPFRNQAKQFESWLNGLEAGWMA